MTYRFILSLIAVLAFSAPQLTLADDGAPVDQDNGKQAQGSSENDDAPPPPAGGVQKTAASKAPAAPPSATELAIRHASFQDELPTPAASQADAGNVVESIVGSNDTLSPPDYHLDSDPWVEGGHLLPTRLFYVHLDYLNWWAKGMYAPPLVTTGPDAASLLLPDTNILFGNADYMTGARSGTRLRLGSDCGSWACGGWEVEVFGLPQDHLRFTVASDANGSPFIGRPFFNINPLDGNGDPDPPARQDAELVSGTRAGEILRGRVTVDMTSSLSGAAARWRCQIADRYGMLQVADEGDLAYASTVSFAGGYRYMRLSEGLLIREDLTAVDLTNNNAETDIDIFDRFDTMNEFNGVDLGIEWLNAHRDWTMLIAGRLALGDIQQSVLIDGQTVNSGVGVGGLLAQTSNIGYYQRNVFGVIPELEARISKRVTEHISFSAGYNLIYWSRVARPGDQVDLDVNPELIPPPVNPVTGPQRPEFVFRDSDYWVQGLSLGVNFEW